MKKKHDQLSIPLAITPSMMREDYVLTPCNQVAHDLVMGWRQGWNYPALVIVGERGSGKTHLANIWCREAKAESLTPQKLLHETPDFIHPFYLVEQVDTLFGDAIAEQKLFHLFNIVREYDGRLLLTAQTPQAQWAIDLPDLSSRMKAMPSALIDAPDDVFLTLLLQKLFSDRQVKIDRDIIDYLLPRVERSTAAVTDLVIAIDTHALAHKRPVTIPLVREVLENFRQV